MDFEIGSKVLLKVFWIKSYYPHDNVSDYGAEKNHLESLTALVTNPKSPWYSDADWSDELPYLRQLAITEPHKLTPSFLNKSFKTLRLINKGVSEHLVFFPQDIERQYFKFKILVRYFWSFPL